MNYYEYNEDNLFIRDSYDLEELKNDVREFGGRVEDEYGNAVYVIS